MSPGVRRNVWFFGLLALILCLGFLRGAYAVERAALGLRYFWWVLIVLVGALWLLTALGRRK